MHLYGKLYCRVLPVIVVLYVVRIRRMSDRWPVEGGGAAGAEVQREQGHSGSEGVAGAKV